MVSLECSHLRYQSAINCRNVPKIGILYATENFLQLPQYLGFNKVYKMLYWGVWFQISVSDNCYRTRTHSQFNKCKRQQYFIKSTGTAKYQLANYDIFIKFDDLARVTYFWALSWRQNMGLNSRECYKRCFIITHICTMPKTHKLHNN